MAKCGKPNGLQSHRAIVSCRERNDGLYRVITYLCFKITEELFIALIASLIFSVVVWFPIQLQGEWVLFWLVYLCTLSNGIGEHKGCAVTYRTRSE